LRERLDKTQTERGLEGEVRVLKEPGALEEARELKELGALQEP
jgi:hypothetical protein